MKKLLLLLLVIQSSVSFGQIYLDDFDDGDQSNTWYAGNGFTSTETDGEWTIIGDGTVGAFDPFGYVFQDEMGGVTIDITENNKIYVRAKASNLGTSLRMDVKDADGFVSTVPGVTKTLVNDYAVFEFNYDGNLVDGGFGGTACETGPCPVDGSRIVELNFFVNPGIGAWAGTVKIDFISVGTEPVVGPMSDVFQDEFNDEISLNYIGIAPVGYVNKIEDGQWKIQGDGTNAMWDPVNMLFYNTATLDTTDVSLKNGNDKIYLRMRTDVPGTSIRMDIMDINDFASTAGSITKVISEEWETYEYNYSGSYQDLAFGGTGCDVGPCDLDSERISNMIIFVNPGVAGFVGEVQIEYISVGTSLEAVDPADNVLAYGDHFSQDYGFVNTSGAYGLNIEDSELTINGSGVDAPFSAVSVLTHEGSAGVFVDATGNNKLYIKAKSDVANTLLRVDLVDTSGFVTTQPSFTRLLDEDYSIIEIDFSSSFIDAGYGGTACEVGPCEVNASAINNILLYPNPADGGFNGNITIDYISFGAEMGDDVLGWDDHFDNDNRDNWSDAGGFTVMEEGSELTVIGDGTAGTYTAFEFIPQDEDGTPRVLNVTSNNKVYIKVKSTSDVPLRIDLVDEGGFVTTEPATLRMVTEDYSVLEFDFSDTYSDGGYGGTSCETGPCPVDGTTVTSFLVYIDPDNGGYDGTLTIDWMSIIEPLEDIIDTGGPLGIDNYSDQFDGDLSNVYDTPGLVLSGDATSLKITGDGTSGAFSPISYAMVAEGDSVIVNAVNNADKLFIRAKSTTEGTSMRIDLVDNMNMHTSQAGITNNISTEYEVIEYNFNGNYLDGGYGGTGCSTGPCVVDGKRVEAMTMYINPSVGAFSGDLDIDWVSFGEPILTNVVDIELASGGKIYPNPMHDMLYLELDSRINGKMNAVVTDLNGKLIQSSYLGNAVVGVNSSSVSLDNVARGMYILTITIDGNPAFVNKIIKQ